MLYLDSSALVKRYVREKGSETLARRCETGERVFTSVLSYAEVLAAVARRCREGDLSEEQRDAVSERFTLDWSSFIEVVELTGNTMAGLRELVKRFNLRGADAVHLCAYAWLREAFRVAPGRLGGEQSLDFGVSDRRLAEIARQMSLPVFVPESGP